MGVSALGIGGVFELSASTGGGCAWMPVLGRAFSPVVAGFGAVWWCWWSGGGGLVRCLCGSLTRTLLWLLSRSLLLAFVLASTLIVLLALLLWLSRLLPLCLALLLLVEVVGEGFGGEGVCGVYVAVGLGDGECAVVVEF